MSDEIDYDLGDVYWSKGPKFHYGPTERHIHEVGSLVYSIGYDAYVLVLRRTFAMREHGGYCREANKIMFQMRPHYEVLVNGITKTICQSRLSKVKDNG
jgi:hypothetical protein